MVFFEFIEAIRCDLENNVQYLLMSEEEEDVLSPPLMILILGWLEL
jgi:hypothetical protein